VTTTSDTSNDPPSQQIKYKHVHLGALNPDFNLSELNVALAMSPDIFPYPFIDDE